MPKLLSHAQRVPPPQPPTKTSRIVATSVPPPKEMPEKHTRKPMWKQVATIPPRNSAMSNNLQPKIESVTKKSNINQVKQKSENKSNETPPPDSNMNRKTNRVINKDQKPYFKLTYLTTP